MNKLLRAILAAEDAGDFVMISEMLEDSPKIELSWVTTYHEAVIAMEEGEHDLYLIDLHLGEHKGIELLGEAARIGCKAPIILISDNADHEIDVQAMRAGAADHLVKSQMSTLLLERSMRYAVDRAQLLETLREMAVRDPLTGLYNCKEMSRLLAEEVERTRRYGDPLSFILFSIDGFDETRKGLGHRAGDTILQSVVTHLRECVRAIDRTARFGDEELAILLPHTSQDEARTVAERLRNVIRSKPVLVPGPNRQPLELRITISIGIACADGVALDDADELVAGANRALYEARRRGHDRLVLVAGIDSTETAAKGIGSGARD